MAIATSRTPRVFACSSRINAGTMSSAKSASGISVAFSNFSKRSRAFIAG
jgi:hypothetical protein